jgi:Zn-dependent protease
MQFKIKNTTYKISFTFLALILFVLTTNKSGTIFLLLLFAILHEIVHLIFIYRFSVAPKKVGFTVLGANISRGLSLTNNINSEIIINLSAPVFNIVTGVFFQLLSISDYNQIFTEIAEVNFALGFFNLIPFHNFDGGATLKYILLKYIDEIKTEQILTWVSLIITVTFSFISIHIFLNYKHNFSLFLMCIYMFISIIFKKQNSLDY